MSYLNEYDLSQTSYPQGWLSKRLIGDPRYTEKMQVFHRWCSRIIEYYRMQAFNNVIVEKNERERDKIQNTRDTMREMMEETFINMGKEIPQTAKSAYEHACKKAVIPASINEGFDPGWIDDELKEHGLYTPDIELVKKWFKLIVFERTKNKVEEMRTGFIEGEMENTIVHAVELDKALEEFWEKEEKK